MVETWLVYYIHSIIKAMIRFHHRLIVKKYIECYKIFWIALYSIRSLWFFSTFSKKRNRSVLSLLYSRSSNDNPWVLVRPCGCAAWEVWEDKWRRCRTSRNGNRACDVHTTQPQTHIALPSPLTSHEWQPGRYLPLKTTHLVLIFPLLYSSTSSFASSYI